MNGHQPTEERVGMTAMGLNQTMDLLKSVRNLRIKHSKHEPEQFPSTFRDFSILLQWLKNKLEEGLVENWVPEDWDKQFFYEEGENKSKYVDEISHVCEVGMDDTFDWFTRNQEWLTKERVKITKKNIVQAEDEQEFTEQDGEFVY